MDQETVKIVNNTVSVHTIGPIETGGELYVLPPGSPVDVPVKFLERFDGSKVLAAKFKTGDLAVIRPGTVEVEAPPETVSDALAGSLGEPNADPVK